MTNSFHEWLATQEMKAATDKKVLKRTNWLPWAIDICQKEYDRRFLLRPAMFDPGSSDPDVLLRATE